MGCTGSPAKVALALMVLAFHSSNRSSRRYEEARPRDRALTIQSDLGSITSIRIFVSVLESFAIVAAVHLAVAERGAVVLRGVFIGAVRRCASVTFAVAIVASFFRAVVVARVKRRLAKLIRSTPVRIAVPVPPATLGRDTRSRSDCNSN